MSLAEHIHTRLIDLPTTISGFCSLDEEGEPMVYLNARLTSHQHKRTFDHELQHIQNNDHHNDLPIEQIENIPASRRPSVDIIYQRGLVLYNLQPNHPFWNKLWAIWALQHEKDILRIVLRKIDGLSQRQAKQMFLDIFAPWLIFQTQQLLQEGNQNEA